MYRDLIFNLSLLVALSVASGFLIRHRPVYPKVEALLQGVLFGGTAVVGMLYPVVVSPGLFFDGRSVVLSLATYFFGPWAALPAVLGPSLVRLYIGGGGTLMGVLVIYASAGIGLWLHFLRPPHQGKVPVGRLYLLGAMVHLVMLALIVVLPRELWASSWQRMTLPVLGLYPLATVLAGKILADQQSLLRLVDSLRRANKDLDVTLHSIGDAVIAADAEGRVLRMNPVAEQLTGWPVAEARHRMLTDIFRLIPEEGHSPVINPVEVVLQTGRSATLANHTLLVARDGTERVIADCAAPIRDEGGVLKGVVLVFNDQTAARAAQLALRESDARWRHAVQASAAGIWDNSFVTGEAFYSDRSKEILGYAPDDISQRMEDWVALIHPDDAPVGQLAMAEHIAGRKPCYEAEQRFRCKDGSYRWIQSRGRAVFDDAGKLTRVVGTHVDIHERKHAEEALRQSLREKEVLLNEVHHRVKNNLQIITSLLRLGAGRSGLPAVQTVLKEMQGRVRSMALLHETLYRSHNLAEVDMATYLRQLATQLVRGHGGAGGVVQLELVLAPVQLEISQAIPCGLIVNELASNSLKHAFPDDRSGHLRIELQPVEGSAQLRLCVSDDGVGMPADFEINRSQSLGLRLVSDLTQQLEGQLEIAAAAPGAAFTLTFLRRVVSETRSVPKRTTGP